MEPQFVTKGWFRAFESFAIRQRNEFYILGRLKEGEVQAGWRIDVRFNSSFSMYLEIKEIADIEVGSEAKSITYSTANPEISRVNYEEGEGGYQLLIIAADEQEINMNLSLNIGRGGELLEVYTEAE